MLQKFQALSVIWILFLFAPSLSAKPVILSIGDSLTFGLGVPEDKTWPQLLQNTLQADGMKDAKVINAGSSGATTAFGLTAVRFQLKHNQPDLILYALGANDGLRAISTDTTYRNISQTIEVIQRAKVKVILLGMKAPPNYGEKFPKDFEKIFARVAAEKKIPFIPFFLDGVAGEPKLNQPDGIHPNEKGYEVITGRMYPIIKGQL